MKYVRTPIGVYEFPKGFTTFVWNNKTYLENENHEVLSSWGNIIAQADNIEELCDEFVIISEEYDEPHCVKRLVDTGALDFEDKWKPYGNGKVLDQYCQKLIDATIYGAIWTGKGLIYVAKMNEKGELELL